MTLCCQLVIIPTKLFSLPKITRTELGQEVVAYVELKNQKQVERERTVTIGVKDDDRGE